MISKKKAKIIMADDHVLMRDTLAAFINTFEEFEAALDAFREDPTKKIYIYFKKDKKLSERDNCR